MNSTNSSESEKPGNGDGLPPVSPDFIEQDFPDEIDNVVPSRGYQMHPMVGLGGSAGSIQALVEFFKTMPADSGMVFVVILHLSPTHKSTMADLLANATTMKVEQAFDGQKVRPNHVYVIPPGKYLATVNGHLQLTELENERGKRVAVDVFFRSLADTHGPHASAIVLSGADGDGAIGIKRIKERGGLTIAQDPQEAEHSSMPRSSIDTGMVDWVLEVRQMPARLLDYHQAAARLKLPPEDGPQPARRAEPTIDEYETALRDVLVFLRMRTGREFSYYKRATVVRRIGRRMQVNGVDNLQNYLDILRTRPGEAQALLQDLLISVTNFFRDREVFETLKLHMAEVFKGKTQSDTVRLWSPACATGEETYSLAMLAVEHARKYDSPPAIQVFGCDLDDNAIQIARTGKYPETITGDVSEERLQKFFVKDAKGYRVRRELREIILFASHDLVKDAPFSRMDLISCRNLLIYLNREAQQRVFEMFHFALQPGGLLLLGSSESVEEGNPLFRVLDKKHRIYVRQESVRAGLPLPTGPSTLMRALAAQESNEAPVVHGKHFISDAAETFRSKIGPNPDRTSLVELHFKLLERYAPPSVIVNAEHDIIHLSDHAGGFLRFAGGEPTTNLLRVVHPALRIELRTALFRAAETGASADSFDVPAEIDGRMNTVHITVSPAADIEPGLFLVTFQRRLSDAKPAEKGADGVAVPSEPAVRHLERELEHLKSNLRDTVEQYEASTEELKASNEELQAMNEELRSATEELETSREELQSINEELTTVNQEMKGKMEEVAHANSDLQNLMASTQIATVFLDKELAIMRFTPAAAAIFNMIPGDIGRPLAHLKHHLDYPELIADAEEVLRTLVRTEREVSSGDSWYQARMQPYRTIEDHIAGTVLTLVDVTDRNRANEARRQSEERLRLLIESATDYAILTTDLERRIDSWSAGAEALFGYAESEILGQLADVLFTPDDRAKGDPEQEANTASKEGRAQNERWHARKDGSTFYGSGSVMPLRDSARRTQGYLKIMRDLTESKREDEAVRKQMKDLKRSSDAAVGQECEMLELKGEIDGLNDRIGDAARHPLKPDKRRDESGDQDGNNG